MVIDVGLQGEACVEPNVGFFLSEWVITEFLVKQCVLHQRDRAIGDWQISGAIRVML